MCMIVPDKSRADSGQQDWGIVLRWNRFVHKSCSHHTLHMHSHPGLGVGTRQLDISFVYTQLHLSIKNIIKKIRYSVAIRSQRPKTKHSPSSSHWARAVLTPSLSSWKDLSINISHTLVVTTYTQSETSVTHLLYIIWRMTRFKLVTITDRAATGVGAWVRTEGCRTQPLCTSHWTTLWENK